MVAKYKYMKHSTNQLTKILTAAEDLFIKKGIEAVSFTEIASCCGITVPRCTAILRIKMKFYGKSITEKSEATAAGLWNTMSRQTKLPIHVSSAFSIF